MKNTQRTSKKPWFSTWWGVTILVVVAVVLIFGGYFAFLVFQAVEDIQALPESSDVTLYDSDREPEDYFETAAKNLPIENRPTFGNPDAPVTIVQFCDFQCPYCKDVWAASRTVMQDRQEDVKWVFLHYPVESIHPEAPRLAQAAECAFQQDAFWEYADLLFQDQMDTSDEALIEIARSIGISPFTFTECLKSGTTEEVVSQDFVAGKLAGVVGTPTFYLNGHQIGGALPETFFQQAIDYLMN